MSGGGDQDDGFIVKLRGLPWSATVDDIIKFFKDCKIAGGKAGVHMTTSREGRPSGEAFVEFEDEEDVERACQKDRDHMGNRYIEGLFVTLPNNEKQSLLHVLSVNSTFVVKRTFFFKELRGMFTLCG